MYQEKGIAETIISEAEVCATTYSLLGGLTFTGAIFFLSFRMTSPYFDYFGLFALISSVLFIFSTVLVESAAKWARNNELKVALQGLEIASAISTFGFVILVGLLVALGFSVRWEFGGVLICIIVLCFIYFVVKIY